MAIVSVSGIEGTASEIQGVNDILKNTATNASTSAASISKLATEFASYNNQISADNPPHYEQYTEGDSICTYNIYDTWVTTTGGLESGAASLASKAEEINSVVDRISSKVADVQTIAVAIQGYIDSIQDILSNSDTMSKCGINLSSGVIASAFLALGRNGVTKANIATSGTDINSRNFLDYDNIKDDEKLSGGLLSFEKQEDGSYLIKKDGESTGYYTTGLAAGLYMKTLVTGVRNEAIASTTNDKLPLKGEEALNNIKKGVSKAFDETKQNYKNFTEGITKTKDKVNDLKDNLSKEAANSNFINNTSKTKVPPKTNFINELERNEQYTYDSQRVFDNKMVKLYKGQSGGYKFVEPLSTGGSKVTYYAKNNNIQATVNLNENGDFVKIITSGD